MNKRLVSAFRIVMFGFLPAGALNTFAQGTAVLSTTGTPAVMLNQSGFYPFGPKLAAITGEGASSAFVLVNAASGDTVFRGNLSGLRKSANSSTVTRIADFSSFTGKGQYRLVVPGAAESYPFAITDKVLQPLAKAAMKAFYFQRVSMPLVMPYAGKWARPAGHPDTAVRVHPSAASRERPAGTMISSPGGWYDAGDYNKYIVNSGITMGTLLSGYEDYSTYFDTSKLNIPESGNNVPDILDEILYNLRWMLTMQDPNDGGVYNKCTNAAFDGTVMPGVTKLPRYVVQKGTAATLDFAAVTAQAARIFARFERQLPGLADSCAKAAKFAWKWSLINPALRYNQDSINQLHEPKLSTGGYGDRTFEDEWFWAASELLVLTGDSAYLPKVRAGISKTLSLPSWPNVHQLGVYTLIRQTIDRGNRKRIISDADGNQLKSAVIALADQYLNGVANNAFLTVMGGRRSDFNWGSNSNAGNQGILMVNAWRYTKDRKYADAALSNLDYLCGRNATGYSFITGIGTKTPMHPHHRPSMADNIVDPVPGLLAGGPNPGMQDKCVYAFKEPETAYVDHDCSYASNEIAINWNAPLVYLANTLEAIQQEAFSKRKP